MNGISEAFQYINSLPEAAVYAIANDEKMEVYINQSTKFKAKLGEVANIQKLMGGRIEVFSSCEDHVYKLILAERIRQRFIARGYKIVNQLSPFIKFKVHIRLDTDLRNFLVYLQSARGAREVVGVFKCINEAEDFKQYYYGENWNGEIVFAINRDSVRYFKGSVYKRVGLWRNSQPKAESNEVTQVDAGEEY